MASRSSVDIAIVGAGIAGLAAASRAVDAGYRVAVFEAKERVGGRAWTVEVGGYPVDLGATWLHSASLNPLVPIASSLGFDPVNGIARQRTFVATGGISRWSTDQEAEELIAYQAATDGKVTMAGEQGRDEPIAKLIDFSSRWAPLYEWWIAAYTAADPENASTLDYALYRETKENLSLSCGLGALVAAFGAGLPVHRSTPVHRIRWGGNGVRLETSAGAVEARTVIVTASTSALARGVVRFDPDLPTWKQEAIDAVPLGSANKIVIAFDRNVFDREDASSLRIDEGTRNTIGLQIRPLGRNLASGYVGGSLSRALEAEGAEAMVDFALARLRWVYGAEIARHVAAARASAWTSDPWIAGAYSASRPGLGHRRADLARPVGHRVFFGGEATCEGFFTTVHGGYISGIRAAKEAIAVLEA